MNANRPAKGIRRTGSGWQVYVRVKGEFRSKHFPPDTDLLDLKTWRDNMKARGWLRQPEPTNSGDTFGHDCDTYLQLVKAMPSYQDREYHIQAWRAALGPATQRTSVTPLDIRVQLERWRATGLKPASLNRRRTALMNLYTVLDGRKANLVRDVPRYDERDSIIDRSHPMPQWEAVLRRLAKGSKTRARLELMLWTGLPHVQVMAIEPAHVDLKRQRLFVSRRRKGRGSAARWLPLTKAAVKALKAFRVADAWGKFSQSAMHSALARAVASENSARAIRKLRPLPHMRPYDARHTFGTLIASLINDERAIQELMLHSTPQQTRRYTEAATQPRLVQAMNQISQKLGAQGRRRS